MVLGSLAVGSCVDSDNRRGMAVGVTKNVEFVRIGFFDGVELVKVDVLKGEEFIILEANALDIGWAR